MSESKNFIFLNGINTNFGGAGKISKDLWISEIKKNHNIIEIHCVPQFSKIQLINSFFLFIYYFPFSILKLLKHPLFEYFYKISFFSITKLLMLKKNQTVILSHHSIFYLKYFIKKSKRILIVHDLIELKSINITPNSFINQIAKKIETILLKNETILIQSSEEKRHLSKQGISSSLIKCYPFKIYEKINNNNDIGLLADWRRDENKNDLTYFLKNKWDHNIMLFLYGYGSDEYFKQNVQFQDKLILKGNFDEYKNLKFTYLLVPNYTGAGIKLKVIEALFHKKIIIGTDKCLDGLEELNIKELGLFYNIEEIEFNSLDKLYKKADFEIFYTKYDELYKNISEEI